jgi:splicing factor 3B subunit 3
MHRALLLLPHHPAPQPFTATSTACHLLSTAPQDKDFFLHLEMHMRQEHPPLAGRDHLAFRSAYFPVREVVDGDLCAQFPAMAAAKQQSVATELDRTPGEVLKKLEDMRNKIL